MKIKLKNIIFDNEFISSLNKLASQDLLITDAFKLKTLMEDIDAKHKVFTKVRTELISKHAKKDQNDKPIKKMNDNGMETYELTDVKGFQTTFQELLDIEQKYEFEPIDFTREEYKKLKNKLTLSVKDLVLLKQLIKL